MRKDLKYAILAEFRLWRFPGSPPDAWRTRKQDDQPGNRCVLTGQKFGLQKAHIVPRGETEWFEMNRMGVLFSSDNRENSVDNIDNLLLLRTDLHQGLDQKLFAFFPKGDKMMLHCMGRNAAPWHNVYLKRDVCKEFLLARFAWTLYPICLAPWLKMKKARMLWVDVNGALSVQEVGGEDCQLLAHSIRPRSTSPKKRRTEDHPVS